MTDDKEAFVILRMKKGGMVTFGDDGKGDIIRVDKIQITPQICLENVLYVLGLKNNLIRISQLCDRGYKDSFESSLCIITTHLIVTIFLLEKDMAIYT